MRSASSRWSWWEFCFGVNQSQIPADVTETRRVTGQSAAAIRLSSAFWQQCAAVASFFQWTMVKTKQRTLKYLLCVKQRNTNASFLQVSRQRYALAGNSPFASQSWIFCGSVSFKRRLRLHIWQPRTISGKCKKKLFIFLKKKVNALGSRVKRTHRPSGEWRARRLEFNWPQLVPWMYRFQPVMMFAGMIMVENSSKTPQTDTNSACHRCAVRTGKIKYHGIPWCTLSLHVSLAL